MNTASSSAFPPLVCCFFLLGCTPPAPPDWLEPTVHRGRGALEKRLVCDETADIGGVTDIETRSLPDGVGPTIVVAGTKGVLFLEPGTYRVRRRVQYNDGGPPMVEHRIVDVDGDGTVEFFRIDHRGRATLYDTNGTPVWTYADRNLDEATVGDVDGDGKPEFVLTGHISDSVHVIDGKGSLDWSRTLPESPTEVILLDTNHDGRQEIVYIDGESVAILGDRGKLIARSKPPQRSNSLHVVRYSGSGSDGRDEELLCVGYHVKVPTGHQVFRLLKLDATTVVEEFEPGEFWRYLPKKPVRLDADRKPFHASIEWLPYQGTIVGFSATRLRLRVHESQRELVYDETLAAEEEVARGEGAFGTVPTGKGGEEALLVGFGSRLWEYRRER